MLWINLVILPLIGAFHIESPINELEKNNFQLYKLLEKIPEIGHFYKNDILYSEEINATVECKRQAGKFLQSIFSEDWALTMFDSWGKIPIGIMEGNFASLGYFDECLKINENITFVETLNTTLETQYCLATFESPLGSMEGLTWPGMIGVCMPKICSPKDTEEIIDMWLKLVSMLLKVNLTMDFTVTECQNSEELPYTSADIIAIVLLSLFGFFSLLSTIYDLVIPSEKQNQLLKSFSWYTNGRRILNTSESSNSLTALHGIKFLSMCWVILCHRSMSDVQMPIMNISSTFLDLLSWKRIYLLAGNFAVDSFFLVGGLLVAYTALRELKKNGKMFNPLIYYLHRYIRLTPAYAIVILINAGLILHFSNGPLYRKMTNGLIEGCQKEWWQNIIYLNNYLYNKTCVGQGWYLAVDMHLYILSPLLLVPFWLWPIIGIIISGGLLCFSFALIFALTYIHDLQAGIMENISTDVNIYLPTHTRFAPYVVGMMLGYFILKSKETNFKIKNKFVLLVIWCADIALLIGLVLSNHPFLKMDYQATLIERAFFNSLHRFAWSIALGWVIYACAIGQGGFINTFLSWKGFIPFSRLSYAMYLIHMNVIYLFVGSLQTVTPYSDNKTIPNTISDIMLSAFFGMILSLLFESPIINIEKLIFGRNKKPDNRKKEIAENGIEKKELSIKL